MQDLDKFIEKNCKEIYLQFPLYVKMIWWAMTAVMVIWLLIIFIPVIINPFWFREQMGNWFTNHIEYHERLRSIIMKPFFVKYGLLLQIKDFANDEV